MALQSMTGFARAEGVSGASHFVWELKSVNAKGVDIRLRLPQGLDGCEATCRGKLAAKISRGTVYGTLSVVKQGLSPVVVINEEVLARVLSVAETIGQRLGGAASVDGILNTRGVVDLVEPQESDEDKAALEKAVVASLDVALGDFLGAREGEGKALLAILSGKLDEIEAHTRAAENNPARAAEAIKAKIAAQIAELLDNAKGFDLDRLHQEALLLASRADIREELDRLYAHITAARQLLSSGAAVGRKLDFLAQEFNRETNTLCSKSNDVSLTSTGLELKALVEQFREQVQNLE